MIQGLNGTNLSIKALVPMNTTQKSFNGKALVVMTDSAVALFSYETLIAEVPTLRGYNATIVYLTESFDYSPTTLKHLREFLLQFAPRFLVFDNKTIRKAFNALRYAPIFGNLGSVIQSEQSMTAVTLEVCRNQM